MGFAVAPLSNHPNRNWRRRMQQAADQFLADQEHLIEQVMPATWYADSERASLRTRIRQAYLAGYQDGRK